MRNSRFPRQTILFMLSGIALVLVIVLAAAYARGVGKADAGDAAAAFATAPDFTLPILGADDTLTLSDYLSGPILVVFWASWCAPCREEAPVLERLWPEYQGRGYTFIGVNIVNTATDAEAFIDEFSITYPNVRDLSGAVYLDWGVTTVAESYFIRPGGSVATRYVGGLTENALRTRLDSLLTSASGPVGQ